MMVHRRRKINNRRALLHQVAMVNRLLLQTHPYRWGKLPDSPVRLLYLNFLAGLARGFGIALGLTLLTAVFLAVMTRIASLNLPLISRFIAEIIRLVEEQLATLPG